MLYSIPCNLRGTSVELFKITDIFIQRSLEAPLNQICKLFYFFFEFKKKQQLLASDFLDVRLKHIIQWV